MNCCMIFGVRRDEFNCSEMQVICHGKLGAAISAAVFPSEFTTRSDLDMVQVKVENKRGMYHLGMKTVYIRVNTTVVMFNTSMHSF